MDIVEAPLTCIFCNHDMYESDIEYSSGLNTVEASSTRLILNCPNCHQRFGLDLKKAQLIKREIDE